MCEVNGVDQGLLKCRNWLEAKGVAASDDVLVFMSNQVAKCHNLSDLQVVEAEKVH